MRHCSDPLFVSAPVPGGTHTTGMRAARNTFSAVEPKRISSIPPRCRPRIPITIRLKWRSAAMRKISANGLPTTTIDSMRTFNNENFRAISCNCSSAFRCMRPRRFRVAETFIVHARQEVGFNHVQQIDLAARINHRQSVVERPQGAGRKIYRYENVFDLHNSSLRECGTDFSPSHILITGFSRSGLCDADDFD